MNNPIQAFQREGLTIAEACAISSIGRTKLYQSIATGELVARKLGKRRIVLVSDLRDFLKNLPIDSQSGVSPTIPPRG